VHDCNLRDKGLGDHLALILNHSHMLGDEGLGEGLGWRWDFLTAGAKVTGPATVAGDGGQVIIFGPVLALLLPVVPRLGVMGISLLGPARRELVAAGNLMAEPCHHVPVRV
jgi:hypothetical protein